MYTNIFTFIAALSLFSFFEVPKGEPGPVTELIFALIVSYLLFFILCRKAFQQPDTEKTIKTGLFSVLSKSLTPNSYQPVHNGRTLFLQRACLCF